MSTTDYERMRERHHNGMCGGDCQECYRGCIRDSVSLARLRAVAIPDQKSLVFAIGLVAVFVVVLVLIGESERGGLWTSLRAYFSALQQQGRWLLFAVAAPTLKLLDLARASIVPRLPPFDPPADWSWGLGLLFFAIASFLAYHDLRRKPHPAEQVVVHEHHWGAESLDVMTKMTKLWGGGAEPTSTGPNPDDPEEQP